MVHKSRYNYPTKFHKIYYKSYNKLISSDLVKSSINKCHKLRYGEHNLSNKLVWVDPSEITQMQVECSETPFKFRHHYDRVALHAPDKARFPPNLYANVEIGGDWDMYTKPHHYDRVFSGLKQYIEDDTPLEETHYGHQYKLREDTYQSKGYKENQYKITKQLIQSVKENGIQTRYERGTLETDKPPYTKQPQHNITVNIDRNGNYIFNNTAHNRLALAKLFEVDSIPVTIVVKHKDAPNR